MIVKSSMDTLHDQHLQQIFKRVWEYNINFEKYTFVVRADKSGFLFDKMQDRG